MTNKIPTQKALAFHIDDNGSFDTFVLGKNELLFKSIRQALQSGRHEFFYIFGPKGSGKSHFLTAFYRDEKLNNRDAYYLDLNLIKSLGVESLYYSSQNLNILDNVDAIAGLDDFELGVFTFFNRWLDSNQGVLIVSAKVSADKLAFNRRDLNTRMQSGISYPFELLDEQDCAKALSIKAKKREFSIPSNVASFLVKHSNRDMNYLVQALNKLDVASLQEQHELTIPFVKRVLNI